MEKRKRKNFSILIGLFVLIFTLAFCVLRANAAGLQTISREGHYGGKVYAVRRYYHTCNTSITSDDTFYNLAATESGFKIFTDQGGTDGATDGTPTWVNDFPDPNTIPYNGGAPGLGIEYFKTGLDAKRINDADNVSTDYAFYADGQTVYMLDISDATSDISVVDSIAINNVRAVQVHRIPNNSSGTYYAFALAYTKGIPGTTTLQILKIDTSETDILSIYGSLDLDKDSGNPNTEGGCDMDLVTYLDTDGDSDFADNPHLFIADGTEGIKAVDLTALYAAGTMPSTANLTHIDTTGTALGIDVVWYGDYDVLYAFVADGDEGLKAYNVTTPANMSSGDTLTGSLAFSYETGYTGKA